MARELTAEEKLMDADSDGRVSRAERRRFRQQAPEQVAQKWGVSYALITQLSESQDQDARAFVEWFNNKTAEYIANPVGFSDDAFRLEFNAQPWAQKYRRAAIEDMDFEARFPDLYRDQVAADVEELRDQAAQYGAVVTDAELRDLSLQKRRFGMTSAQLRNSLATLATAKSGDFRGVAGTAQSSLREWTRRNGISLTDNMLNDYVRKITAGDLTEDDVFRELRNTYVAGAYPAWADRIQAGQDIYDISAPYRQRIATLLEIDESQIDLSDQLLQRGLQGVGPDGKPRVTPLYEFEQEIRKDPRWEFTDNAYDIYSRVGEGLLRTFGFR